MQLHFQKFSEEHSWILLEKQKEKFESLESDADEEKYISSQVIGTHTLFLMVQVFFKSKEMFMIHV